MADLVSPDQIRSRSFRTAFRGFEQAEVAEFLDRIARTIEFLDSERSRLTELAGEPRDGDLQTEFQRVSAEVAEVLEAAHRAAEGMRERAAAETAEWRRSAEDDALRRRREAQSDAEALRGDAWAASKELLDQSMAEAKRVAEEAQRDALAVVGHAERESHRTQAAARRESDEQVRAAKMEAERLIVGARAQHDEIIEAARKQAEAAQERARALEVRRDELLAELETVRSKIHAMETDIGERRKASPPESSQPATVRLIPADRPDEEREEGPRAKGKWSTDEAIRIIPARKPEMADEPVDAASLADEVRRLRDQAALADLAGSPVTEEVDIEVVEDASGALSGPEPTEPAAEPKPITAEPAADDEKAQSPVGQETLAEAGPAPAETPSPAVDAKPWALDSLFATLRSDSEEKAPPAAAPEYPVESEPEPEVSEEPVSEPPAGPTPDGAAIAERDRVLLPIVNRVLRGVKRQLTEAQNLTLEDVRVNEAWDPESIDLAEEVRGDLVVLVQESYAAGHSAAGEILGKDVGRAKPAGEDVPDRSGEFASALFDALSHVAGPAGEQGPRALAASLSRVYRAWRTDEAERRLRGYALRAFHRGMLAGASESGASRIQWVLSGRGCTTCRAAAGVGSVSIDSDFPGIDGVPPVHSDCGCTIVPG